MKKIASLLLVLALTSCVDKAKKVPYSAAEAEQINSSPDSSEEEKAAVNKLLDQWHRAAAEANFEAYFGMMADTSIYIGTDATENWELEEFKAFSKPYFDRGRAWDFTNLERNIYFSRSGKVAWFDELLDTHMGLTRGSGVLTLEDGKWKIQHYVLSLTIPNDNLEEVKAVNKATDSSLIAKFKADRSGSSLE